MASAIHRIVESSALSGLFLCLEIVGGGKSLRFFYDGGDER